jgi:hypothetical protein
MSQHIFISYARKDGKDHAEKFDTWLFKRGFRTWRDKRGIDPTQDFTAEIENAIEAASHVVVCITPDVKRDNSFVRREIGYAEVMQKPIIVARFEDVVPPISVINHTRLDFFGGWDEAFEQLCARLKTEQYISPSPEHADPYKPYLDALYKQIVNYLDKTVFSSLPGMTNTPLLELQGELTPEQVDAPENIAVQALPMAFWETAGVEQSEDVQQVAPYKNFHEAFERYDGRVLLLGEPGGGKTTTLFAFARDKVAERLEQTDKPLPVLVPIVTWNAEAQTPLAEWLAGAVTMLKDDVAGILREGKALLLLDGLDELGSEREEKETKEKYDPRLRFMSAVQPLSPTLAPSLTPPAERGSKATHADVNQMVVTCRVKDYEEIGAKLALQGAVTLKPLNDAQMKAYLRDLPELWKVLENDKELRAVAQIPLLLSFFAYAFTGLDEAAKALGSLSRGDVRDKIFETYVRRRYEWEERRAITRGEMLPFKLKSLYKHLGLASINNITTPFEEENVIGIEKVSKNRPVQLSLFPRSTLEARIVAFAVQMNILIYLNKANCRFIHLALRDYFAFQKSLQNIQDSESEDTNSIDALGELGDSRAVEPLLFRLQNTKSNLYIQRIIEAIARIGDQSAVAPLIDIVQNEAAIISSVAAEALGKLGDVSAVKPLINCLSSSDKTLRWKAAIALGQLNDSMAVTPLIKALNDKNTNVRYYASEALGKLGDAHAVKALISLLSDTNRRQVMWSDRVCDAAAKALIEIGTPEALFAVKKWKHE